MPLARQPRRHPFRLLLDRRTEATLRQQRHAIGLSQHARLQAQAAGLLAALAESGWSEPDLAGLTSGNILRVMRDVESVATRLRSERGPSLATYPELL